MLERFLPFLIIGIMTAVMIYAWRREKKRRQILLGWAKRNNWHFRPEKRSDMDSEYPGIKLFDQGHTRQARNIITGHFQGMPVSCLDYQYVTGSGKNRSTHSFGVVLLQVDHPLIPLQIRRENILDKVGEFLGVDDIDFESAEFSRKFFVKSPDKKWAYDVVHARTMEYLLAAPSFFNFEFGHNEIMVYKGGHCDPGQYEQAVDLAEALYDLIPDYVRQQMKGS